MTITESPRVPASIAAHDDYLYVQCDLCEDHITWVEAGDSLDELIVRVEIHLEMEHDRGGG